PAGARARTPPAGGKDGSLTLDDYLKLLYPDSSTEKSALEARGFVAAATRWYTTSDGHIAAVYLIEFDADSGADSYADGLSAAHENTYRADSAFAVQALHHGTGFEEKTLDAHGNTRSFAYGAVGNVTVLVHYYVPAKLDLSGLLSVVSAQVAALQKGQTV
ncbi:MAG: hypothetical protein ACRDVE_17740, partial [Actinocrinis sp.]